MTGAATGTESRIPIEVAPATVPATVDATVDPAVVKVKKGTATVGVAVTSTGATPTGTVEAWIDGQRVARGTLVDGAVDLRVGPWRTTGTREIEIRYLGDAETDPGTTTVTVEVTRSGKAR